MRNQRKVLAGLVGSILAAAALPAMAVQTDIDGYYYELPTGAKANNLDAVRALIKTSDALGMTRRQGATNAFGLSTASHEYRASGMWNGAKADLVVIDFDYRLQAVRVDVTTGKTEAVTVVAKDLVWDEKTPGVFAKASTDKAADRLLPTYLLPHAVVYFGGLAADKIKLSKNGSNIVLTVPLPAPFNTNIVATVDANGTPVHTEIAFGGKSYTGDFDDFTNDRMDNHVFGPTRIVLKTDGKVTTDLDVEWHWTAPYMVFPTPKELAAK